MLFVLLTFGAVLVLMKVRDKDVKVDPTLLAPVFCGGNFL